jgi:hypothetical protein
VIRGGAMKFTSPLSPIPLYFREEEYSNVTGELFDLQEGPVSFVEKIESFTPYKMSHSIIYSKYTFDLMLRLIMTDAKFNKKLNLANKLIQQGLHQL